MYIKENVTYFINTVKMALIELRKLYRGAVLGWFWLIAKPMMIILVYWFAFGIGLKLNGEVSGYPYFIWLLVGLLPWMYISDILQKGPDILKRYSYLVTKMTFPISTIPTFVSLARLIVNAILTVVVIVIYAIVTKNMDIYLLQLPFYFVMMGLLFTVLALLFSFFSAMSKDIANLIKTLSMPILFLSPILWNINDLPYEWLKAIELFNPVTYIVEGYRNTFVYKIWFYEDWKSLYIFLSMISVLLVFSSFVYKKTKQQLSDYL